MLFGVFSETDDAAVCVDAGKTENQREIIQIVWRVLCRCQQLL